MGCPHLRASWTAAALRNRIVIFCWRGQLATSTRPPVGMPWSTMHQAERLSFFQNMNFSRELSCAGLRPKKAICVSLQTKPLFLKFSASMINLRLGFPDSKKGPRPIPKK